MQGENTQPETQFNLEFRILNEALDLLYISVQELIENIHPVLAPPDPLAGGSDGDVKKNLTSRFVENMSDARNTIWLIKSHVDEVKKRVEL